MKVVILLAVLASCAVAAPPGTTCGTPAITPRTTRAKRIVGGTEAIPGSWPWLALMVDQRHYIVGTASLLTDRVLVSSAQNFEAYSTLQEHHWRVYLGEHNISTAAKEQWETTAHIQNVLIHPAYNSTSLANDVALVFLTAPVSFNDWTSPICLPQRNQFPSVGTVCWLAGWGRTHNTGSEETLNQVDLPILDPSVCATHFAEFLPNFEACAGYEQGHKDFCAADIGSPLMYQSPNGNWQIAGIGSSGGDCRVADEPGVFEDFSHFVDWAKAAMENNGHPYPYHR